MTLVLGFISFFILSIYGKLSVSFSEDRGFYDKPFNLTLESNGTIVYIIAYTNITARTIPAVTTTSIIGTVYTKPLLISKTCVIRALAYIKVGNIINTSTLKTHSFIFLSDVVIQPNLDQRVTVPHATAIIQGFTKIPSFSFSSPAPFPTNTSRLPNPTNGTIEWLDPKDPSDNWAAPIEYDMYGGGSRGIYKKNLKVHFRDFLGQDKIKFDLFKGMNYKGVRGVKTFSAFNLRGGSFDSLFATSVGPILYTRGLFYEYSQNELGSYIPRGRMVHVYFNTDYMGLYHLRERYNKEWIQQRLGAEKEDYETVQEWQYGLYNRDGRNSPPVWKAIVANFTWNHMKDWIDWENLLSFVMTEQYNGNIDHQDYHNWQAVGPMYPKPWQGTRGGWKFWTNDPDAAYFDFSGVVSWSGGKVAVFDVNIDVTNLAFKNYNYPDTYNYLYPDRIFVDLVKENHPDFMTMFYDMQYRLYFKPKGAILSAERSTERFFRLMNDNSMNLTIIPEIARYGDNKGPNTNGRLFTLADYYAGQLKILSWFNKRLAVLKMQYTRNRWIFPTGAVQWSLEDDSIVTRDTVLTISTAQPGLKVAYTTNEEDPRLVGGIRNSNAKVLTTPFNLIISETTVVKARIYHNNSAWGVIDQITLRVNDTCLLCGNIVFTEIFYKTADVNTSINPKGHFVELKNIGKSPLLMTGARIKGLGYDFPSITIRPNQFYVIAEYYEDFKKIYGKYPDDVHTGRVYSQGLEGLKLEDSIGRSIHHIKFDSTLPYPELPDGFGPSLVAKPELYSQMATVGAKSDDSDFKYWRYSSTANGSPWKDDPAVPPRIPNIKFSNFSRSQNWVELFNPTTQNVDLSGWALRNRYIFDKGNHEYILPPGTLLRPSSFLRLEKLGKINLTRDTKDDPIILFKYDQNFQAFTAEFIEIDASTLTPAPTRFPTSMPTTFSSRAPTSPTNEPTTSAPTEEVPTFEPETPTREPTVRVPTTRRPTRPPTDATGSPTEIDNSVEPTSNNNNPTMDPASPAPTGKPVFPSVTWTFMDGKRHLAEEVHLFIRPALLSSTKLFLSFNGIDSYFKRDTTQTNETWTATVIDTANTTSPQAEINALSSWLNSRNDVSIVQTSTGGGSSGPSQTLIVAMIVVGSIMAFLVFMVITVFLFKLSSKERNVKYMKV